MGNAPRRGADGQPDESLPPAPAFATGSLDIQVPPLVRTLTVEAKAQDDVLAPAETTTIDVTVTGPDGKPVPDAEVALVVADEAVLALTDYQIPDPIAAFYPARSADVSDNNLRHYVWLADPASLAAGDLSFTSAMGQGAERGGGGGGDGAMVAEMMVAPAAMADEAAVVVSTGRWPCRQQLAPTRASHWWRWRRAGPRRRRTHRPQPPGPLRPDPRHRCRRHRVGRS